jgi:hypothetical protein
VLWLDFSRIGGTIDELGDNFNNYCTLMLDAFIRKYKDYYGEGIMKKLKNLPFIPSRCLAEFSDARKNTERCDITYEDHSYPY